MHLTQLSPFGQQIFHSSVVKKLKKLDFVEFTPSERIKENKDLGLTPSEKQRQVDATGCSTWRKVFAHGYMVEVILRFSKKNKAFLKTGKLGIQIKSITNMQKQLVYLTFLKQEDSKARLLAMAKFFIKVLENIPKDSSGEYMKLVKRGKNTWNYHFVSRTNKKEKVLLFSDEHFNLLDPTDREIVKDISRNRADYIEGKPDSVGYVGDSLYKRTARKKNVLIKH